MLPHFPIIHLSFLHSNTCTHIGPWTAGKTVKWFTGYRKQYDPCQIKQKLQFNPEILLEIYYLEIKAGVVVVYIVTLLFTAVKLETIQMYLHSIENVMYPH